MYDLWRTASRKRPTHLYTYCRHYLPATLTCRRMLQEIDFGQFHRSEPQPTRPEAPSASARYIDARRYLMIALHRLYSLQLHRVEPIRVLDLGTGPGYFPYVCRFHGHAAQGTDVEGVEICDRISELLRVPRTIWPIRAFEPAPDLGNRFELITAFMICFNKSDGGLWGVPEWDFFLRDLAQRVLTSHGAVYLAFHRERTGHYICPELQRYFEQRGARVSDGKAHFRSMRAFCA